jgi:hypothetical protein
MDTSSRYETVVHIPSDYEYEIYNTEINQISFKKDLKEISEKMSWFPKLILTAIISYRTVSTNTAFNIAENSV